MKATEFTEYLKGQAEIINNIAVYIENGELDGGIPTIQLNLDKLIEWQNGYFELEI